MLKEGEDLNNPTVMLRVACETEHLPADSLSASGSRLVDRLAPLKEGEECFVNGHLEVFPQSSIP